MVKVTKGGKGPIGSKVKAPGGNYIHERQAAPNKKAEYYTVKSGGHLIRVMKTDKGSKVQSILSPVKKKR